MLREDVESVRGGESQHGFFPPAERPTLPQACGHTDDLATLEVMSVPISSTQAPPDCLCFQNLHSSFWSDIALMVIIHNNDSTSCFNSKRLKLVCHLPASD